MLQVTTSPASYTLLSFFFFLTILRTQQGWHIPQLLTNSDVEICALVDKVEQPTSSLNPKLQPIHVLAKEKCNNCPCYKSVEEMLSSMSTSSSPLDGVVVCTPHSTHYSIARQLLLAQQLQHDGGTGTTSRPLHILLEKPMTTDVEEAKKLHELVRKYEESSCATAGGGGTVMINHSANFRRQTGLAKSAITTGDGIGTIRHVSARMSSPLFWLFDDPRNIDWNRPSAGMLGNGFAWGQISHLLAWIYHVASDLQPNKVYCVMNYSKRSGADVSHSATITCNDDVTFSLSGTCLLPGNEHGDPPKGKDVGIEIYGSNGTLFYRGDDHDPTSGKLELHLNDAEGSVKVLSDEFHFENAIQGGEGPESLQAFLSACRRTCGDCTAADGNASGSSKDNDGEISNDYVGADTLVGLKCVQTLDAMYRSSKSGNAEDVRFT